MLLKKATNHFEFGKHLFHAGNSAAALLPSGNGSIYKRFHQPINVIEELGKPRQHAEVIATACDAGSFASLPTI